MNYGLQLLYCTILCNFETSIWYSCVSQCQGIATCYAILDWWTFKKWWLTWPVSSTDPLDLKHVKSVFYISPFKHNVKIVTLYLKASLMLHKVLLSKIFYLSLLFQISKAFLLDFCPLYYHSLKFCQNSVRLLNEIILY